MVEGVKKPVEGNEYDLVIIGCGYMGAWLAYYASKYLSGWKMLVVDKAMAGTGASYYGADLDFPNNRTAEHKKLSSKSRMLINKALQDIPGLSVLASEAWAVASSAKDIEQVMNGQGEETSASAENITLPVSGYNFTVGGVGFIVENVNTFRATDKTIISTLLGAAQNNAPGIHLLEGAEVIDIKSNPYENEIIFETGIIKSKYVITAVGPWSAYVPWLKKLRGKIRVKKIVAFHLPVAPEPDDKVIYMLSDSAFLMPQPELGQWLLSITSKEWDCRPEIEHLQINNEDRDTAKNVLAKYAPDLVPFLSGGRVFCDAYTGDGYPEVISLTNEADILFAGGCSGSGFRLSPAIAYQAIELLSIKHKIK